MSKDEPEVRGKGVARALIGWTLRWFGERGVR